MPEPRTGVTVTPRPDGADLHIGDTYLRPLLHDLLTLLADKPALLDDLLSLYADPASAADRYRPDVASRDEALIDRLMTELPTTIRLYLTPARRLGAALGRITRRQARRPLATVPAQDRWAS